MTYTLLLLKSAEANPKAPTRQHYFAVERMSPGALGAQNGLHLESLPVTGPVSFTMLPGGCKSMTQTPQDFWGKISLSTGVKEENMLCGVRNLLQCTTAF